MHDVVIVGAGPAGAATAHFLSRRGFDVVLLDRADFPRDKTCGDGLTPRALRVLDQMGILSEVRQHGRGVDAYEVVAPNGKATSAPIDALRQAQDERSPGALVVPRLTLDEIILRRAIQSGARFEPGVSVSCVEPTSSGARIHADKGQSFDARVAVIATGAATGVLKRSGVLSHQPRAMLAARAYFEDLQLEVARSFQLRFDCAPMPGYGWIFPVGKHAANVGVGFLPQRRSTTTAHRAFGRFIEGQGVRGVLAGSRQTGPPRGYPIRVDFLRAPTYAAHTLLVGEAAGLVNPLTGEGIDYALESGQIATEYLSQRFESGLCRENFASYDRLLRERFERIFRFSEWIRDWYCKPPLLNALVPLANRRPELRQLLADVVLGQRQPRGYGPITMLARLLVYLVRMRSVTP